jgi:hypothetical protein
MNRGRVGEERGSKEKDRCSVTVVSVYLDDILIFTSLIEEHHRII